MDGPYRVGIYKNKAKSQTNPLYLSDDFNI